ncbi:MAG: alpha-glucosidase [Firmicutes bacterium]|nr:alpha-glucosidase [Candidatus Colivicinus equi]
MLPWWKERVFYQIYPRSFKDSNGDGIGDLKGIISKLDYLKELGIGAVWLCPIYDSPNADMGYDIRDYEKIMSEFGDMDDFDILLEEMHKRDIKLIMDLVVNHSSDEHRWFIESRKSKDNPYRDYYIWADGKNDKEPNNWSSFFTPSAWSYCKETGQWYLHLFAEKQPGLNWENPNLREEIYAMINRWFDKGVDGFRMDVITLISKNTELPDGKGEGYVFSPEYFALQPKMHEYLRELRNKCFRGRDCMCVGEATFANETNANTLVGDGNELDLIFQFDLMDIDGGSSKWDLREFDLLKFKSTIEKWQKTLDWNTLFWGNHDQPRVVSRFGSTESEELRNRSAKCLAIAMYLLRGTPFIYQGEELGMTNYLFENVGQLRDIESINLLKQNDRNKDWAWKGIKAKGRDNARTPMQWNNSNNAGFTNGNPWIEVNPNYVLINAEDEEKDSNSILNFYKKIIKLRNSNDVLINGEFNLLWPDHKQLFAYERIYENKKYTIICNISNKNTNLPEKISGNVVLSNFDVLEEFIPFGAAVYVNDD